jgi:hypothetical protein
MRSATSTITESSSSDSSSSDSDDRENKSASAYFCPAPSVQSELTASSSNLSFIDQFPPSLSSGDGGFQSPPSLSSGDGGFHVFPPGTPAPQPVMAKFPPPIKLSSPSSDSTESRGLVSGASATPSVMEKILPPVKLSSLSFDSSEFHGVVSGASETPSVMANFPPWVKFSSPSSGASGFHGVPSTPSVMATFLPHHNMTPATTNSKAYRICPISSTDRGKKRKSQHHESSNPKPIKAARILLDSGADTCCVSSPRLLSKVYDCQPWPVMGVTGSMTIRQRGTLTYHSANGPKIRKIKLNNVPVICGSPHDILVGAKFELPIVRV